MLFSPISAKHNAKPDNFPPNKILTNVVPLTLIKVRIVCQFQKMMQGDDASEASVELDTPAKTSEVSEVSEVDKIVPAPSSAAPAEPTENEQEQEQAQAQVNGKDNDEFVQELMGGSSEKDSLQAPLNRDTSLDEDSLASLDISQNKDTVSPSVASLPTKKRVKAGPEPWSLSAEERQAAHNSLRVMEAQRRLCYEPKFQTSRAYWISVRELLKTSLEETKQTSAAINAFVSANIQYAQHLKLAASSKAKSSAKPNPVQDACETVSLKFLHESTTMTDMILVPLNELNDKLDSEMGRMQRLGDTLHDELQTFEVSVQHYWSLYYESFYKSLSATQDHESAAQLDDVWLAETQYRLAVKAQATSWTKVDPELTKLFSSMKALEVHRRSTLNELSRMILQQQDVLFSGLTGVVEPALERLANCPVDYATVDADIKASIHSKAIKLATADPAAPTTMTPPSTPYRSLSAKTPPSPASESLTTVISDETHTQVTQSPLSSALVRDVRILKRQTTNTLKRMVRSQIKFSLAVVTADGYLHLMDLSSESDQDIDTVFEAMIPPVTVSTALNPKAPPPRNLFGSSSAATSRPALHLTPSLSIHLPSCSITFDHYTPDNAILELVEVRAARGASRLMLQKTKQVKMQLQLPSRSEALDYLYHLDAANIVYIESPDSEKSKGTHSLVSV